MRRILTIVLLITAFAVLVTIPFYIWGVARFTAISIQEKSITDILLATLELIGIFVAVVIVVMILYQYFRYSRPYRLVFEAFSNESKLVDTEQKPLNLSMLAQEELERQFKIIYKALNAYSDKNKQSQAFEALVADELYIEEEALENNVGVVYVSADQIKKSGLIEDLKEVIQFLKDPKGMNLISLIGEIAPKEVAPFMKFIEAVIPPHIIKATGYLQWRSDKPGNVGITFKYEDLGNQRNLMVRTLWWQESDKSAISAHNHSSTARTATNDTVTNTMADHYIDLLKPTMHWMALMFWEQKLISHVPSINRILKVKEKRRQARILYLLGALYYAHADKFQAYKVFFCQLAVEHFRQASVKDPSWPLPYLYLANLYSLKALESPKEMYEKLAKEAQGFYEQALEHTTSTNVHTQPRIILAKALAELASGIETKSREHIKKATQEVESLKKQIDPADFDPDRADCAGYLYNLAIWYELAYDNFIGIPNVIPREEARRYLAYSLARSRELWDKVENDESFKSMREEGDLEILKEELNKKLSEEHGLDRMTGEPFKTEISKILEKVDQMLKRGV